MERLRRVLRALMYRALTEHGRNPPALADIVVESAIEPRLWAEFANGYRTSATVVPEDCFAFCEAHAAWDLATLRVALRSEAQRIYLSLQSEFEQTRERERRAWVGDQMRRLGRGLAQTLRPRRAPYFAELDARWLDESGTAAHQRGALLLKENLTNEQLKDRKSVV